MTCLVEKLIEFLIEEQKYLSLTERKFDGSWDKIWGLADILLLLP